MKSLDELQSQLLNIRISAANDSLWSLGATIGNRARTALNDAIGAYKYRVSELFTSGQVTDRAVAIVMPRNTDRVISVHAVDASGATRVPIKAYTFLPTTMTKLLRIDQQVKLLPATEAIRDVEVEYEARLKEFPPLVAIAAGYGTQAAAMDSAISWVRVTGGSPATVYDSPGYLEITSVTTTAREYLREVVRYEQALPTGFTGITRAVEGALMNWSGGDIVSPVFEGPSNAVPTIMASAEASMYHFWISHRSLYDQWAAVSGLQAIDTEQLLGLVRTEEDRADRRYRKSKKLPRPGDAQIRRHRPDK